MRITIRNRKIVRQGKSRYFYIPKVYFDNGQLKDDKIYQITIIDQKPKDNLFEINN